MLNVRRSDERGHTEWGWLDSRHTFSFGDYHTPEHRGFRTLRVINDDVIAGGGGFGAHPHQDMEILTWVLRGAVAHRDSTGGAGIIGPGEIQRMTAGSGIIHSEANASETEPLRLLQIWIRPDRKGLKPGYEQTTFPQEALQSRLILIAAPNGPEVGAVQLNQDARVFAGRVGPDESITHVLTAGRGAWIQVATGSVELNGVVLREGDGASMDASTTTDESLSIRGLEPAEILLFDLA